MSQILITKFNKKLYKQKAIRQAMTEYNKLADFKLETKDAYYIVSMKQIDSDLVDTIKDEFSNYVLYLMKQSTAHAK